MSVGEYASNLFVQQITADYLEKRLDREFVYTEQRRF